MFFVLAAAALYCSNAPAQLKAFPQAEGFGKYAAGGRGGKVYEVTSLEDKGAGSLRAAVEAKGARTVVFKVSGTIKLASRLTIKNDSITIAGQTAPGDGVCVSNYPVIVNANEVIIRYLRIRLGDTCPADEDAFGGINQKKNIIIDHCSASWSIDETFTFYGMENFTAQWCMITESLYRSHHEKGSHGYGGIWGGKNATYHHNLLAHHSSRNPRFAGGETTPCVNVDFRNNVIYNWGFNSAYGGEAGTINIVGNYFKPGPATTNSVKWRIVEPSDTAGKWYIDSNFVFGNAAISSNNWAGGVQGSYQNFPNIKVSAPFPYSPVKMYFGEELFKTVLENAGAVLPVRDTIDRRIAFEAAAGTAFYYSRYYNKEHGFGDNLTPRGIIDSQSVVGGWPVLNSIAPPADSDHDGIPDYWETAHGLNPNDAEDRNKTAPDGYTWLENYLNETGSVPLAVNGYDKPQANDFTLLTNFPNPFNPSTRISYKVLNNTRVLIDIYNILGKHITTLVDENKTPGIYETEWNANKSGISSGVFFIRFISGNRIITKKAMLIK
jgi:pectate lyase